LYKKKIAYLGLLFVFLLTGCSNLALPIDQNVDKVIVYSPDGGKLIEYTDEEKVNSIISTLNSSSKISSFDDPEPLGDLYEIVIEKGAKTTTYFYNDMSQFGGKIYTEKSALKGQVWELPDEFGNTLLGIERLDTLRNE
jgi:hypothetical protein